MVSSISFRPASMLVSAREKVSDFNDHQRSEAINRSTDRTPTGKRVQTSSETLRDMAKGFDVRSLLRHEESAKPKEIDSPAKALPLDGQVKDSVDGYRIGSPERPEISWDNDFPYDPDAKPTVGDHAAWAEWGAKLNVAKAIRQDLDDALDLYAHYRGGSGEAKVFDYEEAVAEDSNVALNVQEEIVRAAAAADQMVMAKGKGEGGFQITGQANPVNNYPDTENWQKTIGGYQQWSSADVKVENGMVTMTVTVHAEDCYNFNRGQKDLETKTPDDVNGRFSELGWAKGFLTSGSVTRTISWPVGSPPASVDVASDGGGARNPGGEDRVDR